MEGRYVLLTAAKDEEKYIEYALRSVARQTVLPLAWYIVDDGSSDRTPDIVRDYRRTCPFIRLIVNRDRQERSFGAQYRAITSAYLIAKKDGFPFVGVHDADIAVERNDYYEQVLNAFDADPLLGISGGYISERRGDQWCPRPANSPDAVAGGIQMFRRACFDGIGGYVPLLFGGEDWLAQIDARRAGWHVRAQPCLAAYHYRATSSAGGRFRGLFRLGMMDASFGSHPIFELFKCTRRVREKPAVLGSAIRMGGFLWWNMSRRTRLLPPDKCAYLRNQQLIKLRSAIAQAGTRGHRPARF